MKWYNKDKTRCLDISKVGYWDYSPSKYTPIEMGSALSVSVNGDKVAFYDEEADEIYKLLTSEREVL